MQAQSKTFFERIHLDWPLLLALLTVSAMSLVIIHSADGGEGQWELVLKQLTRMAMAYGALFALAQVPPKVFRTYALPLFTVGVVMLILVLAVGHIGKGAQRWLDIGVTKFQPSEIMKLAVPMMVAWYLSQFPLPPKLLHLAVALIIVMIPTVLIVVQPDLGTSILIAASGIFVIFLAGLSWRLIFSMAAIVGCYAPVHWTFIMYDYQKQRVLTFLNPESDPLGSGYHIIQSKIAIGSGGLEGKGYMQGTQSQLEFLPERHTDFVFALFSEEFGLLGVCVLIALYLFIIARGLYIAVHADDTFSKMLAGSLTLTFFVYVFVNIGMVSGMLPVVGVPLPLVSYGGTSMVTLMAGFGMVMSVATHQRFLRQPQ